MPGIFVLSGEGELVEMAELPYDSEDVLQRLLADYPGLLGGDRSDAGAPHRYLLVRREAGVPDQEGGSDRWSADHLFLDDEGTPTLVEVKRSTDSRIRREVVGQMLDYAANAIVYWPEERVRADFEARCQVAGRDAEEVLREFLGNDADPEGFWQRVRVNLEAGKVRLMFVADVIPMELQRVVEFLNQQMRSAEVLAIEVKQYGGGELKTLVARLIGQTAAAAGAKGRGSGTAERRVWDEESVLAGLLENRGLEQVEVARRIFEWSKGRFRQESGTGFKYGTIRLVLDRSDITFRPIYVSAEGYVGVSTYSMPRIPGLEDIDVRREFLRRLNKIPGVALPDIVLTESKWPTIQLVHLVPPDSLTKFLAALDWLIAQVKPPSSPEAVNNAGGQQA